MKTNLQEFFKSNKDKLPTWLVKNPVVNNLQYVNKVFPSIGLNNFTENVELSFSDAANVYAKNLLYLIFNSFYYIKNSLGADRYYSYADRRYIQINLSDEELKLKNACDALYASMYGDADHILTKFSSMENGKIKLKLYQDISVNNEVIFKAGEGLIKVYNKILEKIKELGNPRIYNPGALETYGEFKSFSANNIPSKQYQIVFSSCGENGLWDIATMSEKRSDWRSCQAFDGQYRTNLVGSIIDPFTAIIYLTDGKMATNGLSMIKRSVVRFVVDAKKKKPYILIEKMYPNFDANVLNAWTKSLSNKLNDKYEIIYAPTLPSEDLKNKYIPFKNHPFVGNAAKYASYRDSKIPYDKPAAWGSSVLEKNIKNRKTKFTKLVSQSFTDADIIANMAALNINSMARNENIKNSIRTFISSYDCAEQIRDFYKEVARAVHETINPNDFHHSNDAFKKMCYLFLLKRKEIAKKKYSSFLKKINTSHRLQPSMRADHLLKILEPIDKMIVKSIKLSLKEVIEKSTNQN